MTAAIDLRKLLPIPRGSWSQKAQWVTSWIPVDRLRWWGSDVVFSGRIPCALVEFWSTWELVFPSPGEEGGGSVWVAFFLDPDGPPGRFFQSLGLGSAGLPRTAKSAAMIPELLKLFRPTSEERRESLRQGILNLAQHEFILEGDTMSLYRDILTTQLENTFRFGTLYKQDKRQKEHVAWCQLFFEAVQQELLNQDMLDHFLVTVLWLGGKHGQRICGNESLLNIIPHEVATGAVRASGPEPPEASIMMVHSLVGLANYQHIQVLAFGMRVGRHQVAPPRSLRQGFLDGGAFGIPDAADFHLQNFLDAHWAPEPPPTE